MALILQDICLDLDSFKLEVSLEAQGPVTALFGPSGSGKTSLLDAIAGLRPPRSGRIQIGRHVLADAAQKFFLPARQRGIGYVPQDLALFPHLTVRQNLLYGYRQPETGKPSLEHVVDVLEIKPLLPRSVQQISGGEQQRVALARALLTAPRLLLLDEPLAKLDLPLKLKILPYLARIRDEFRIPMLYVTHDRLETLSLATEMAVIIRGRIAQKGTVQDVFNRPATVDVAALLTIETIQSGRVVSRQGDLVRVAVGPKELSATEANLPLVGTEVYVCIRAEDVILVPGPDAPSSARNHLSGVVQAITRTGAVMRVDIDCGFPLAALITRQALEELALVPGRPVLALVKAPHVHLIRR